jgi:2-oxoglutarate ferredoxin oxidoreductase subunit delta
MTPLKKMRTREDVLAAARAATREYPGKAVTIQVNEAWCKGCAICVEFCPKKILAMNRRDKPEVTDIDSCTKCMKCEQLCPDFAIVVLVAPGKPKAR